MNSFENKASWNTSVHLKVYPRETDARLYHAKVRENKKPLKVLDPL